ncbi:MAG: hypothetical protein M3Z14_04665 [Candidatus Eremiobacteraeota bacterium]|nr:hypothetical protein [Candidatus Eremiobacteraeota bacterium]
MSTGSRGGRFVASLITFLYVASFIVTFPTAASAQTPLWHNGKNVLYNMKLPNGNHATVYENGKAEITTRDRASEFRLFPVSKKYDDVAVGNGLPSKGELMTQLTKDVVTRPFVAGRVVVVFRDGVSPSSDTITISRKTLQVLAFQKLGLSQTPVTPAYTNDARINQTLAGMGVSTQKRLFRNFGRSMLSGARSWTQVSGRPNVLNIANAYRLTVTRSSVPHAVAALLKLPGIAYAAPDWIVSPMHSRQIPIPAATVEKARRSVPPRVNLAGTNNTPSTSTVPTNYAVSASAQSMLNAPSNNAVAALDEIEKKFHQLPGQGEIVTNVSLGDLDDASAAANPNDPCNFWVSYGGPTTIMSGGQRYIDWPSMPLIAAYSADANGNLDGTTEVCGVDPQLGEVGLDFSMMAPLPHNLQRSGETGSGLGDLLGIAPGATYRLVVPRVDANFSITLSDIDAAFLATAQQTPRPNVITASLGFAEDTFGFPSRYLEDDPLTQAIVASIVQNYNVVVCISANDGTRTFTNAAIGPSGGSAPTEQINNGGNPTDLNDIGFSTVPSRDFDSGSIDVGGTTLDDIFAAPPQYAQNARLASQHAFAETRWTGFTSFSSGFGSRVNLSAPSDNVLGVAHPWGGKADAVQLFLDGGTSASAPEAAAAVAVALQVARLTGHPFHSATEVRGFLAKTETAVPGVPQSDVYNNVGPQVDVGRAVELLLKNAGIAMTPGVPRVAIEQRRNFGNLDGSFLSDTDEANIDLRGPISTDDGTNTDRNEKAWITIAPDWEGLPADAQFRLNVVGHYSSPLATTRWTRLLPEHILRMAGLPLVSTGSRTVKLRYRAFEGTHHLLAEKYFSVTFGPADPTTRAVLAPMVSPVVRGQTISVSYNLQNVRNVRNPTLVVSRPGRVSPATSYFFNPSYSVPLSGLSGIVQVPVNKLEGGGIYGIGILFGSVCCDPIYGGPDPLYSDFAFTRVTGGANILAPTNEDPRPPAPLLSSGAYPRTHFLDIPYGRPMQVAWSVQNVPSATGALLEVSAPAPSLWLNYNPFNNPNGTITDNNGVDTGSIFTEHLSGASGTFTVDSTKLVPGFQETVRVIPMRGGTAVGEGGDVSTVLMHGIVPSDGGTMTSGYEISPNGTDGLLTSFTGPGTANFTAETFSQISNRTTHLVINAPSVQPDFISYFTHGFGYSANLGLLASLCDADITCSERTFNLVDTESGKIKSTDTPSMICNLCLYFGFSALNSNIHNAPLLVTTDGNGGMYRFLTSNISANTFSQPYDISAPLAGCTETYQARGFAVNTTTNKATAVFDNTYTNCKQKAPIIITIDLANGKFTSFVGRGNSLPFGAAIDSSTNKLAVNTLGDNGLSIYDLTSKRSFEVTVPGGPNAAPGVNVVADSIHHLFLLERPWGANLYLDNNAMGEVLVYNEDGHLLKDLKRFNNVGLLNRPDWYYLQINASHRKGYFLTPGGAEIEPFSY